MHNLRSNIELLAYKELWKMYIFEKFFIRPFTFWLATVLLVHKTLLGCGNRDFWKM